MPLLVKKPFHSPGKWSNGHSNGLRTTRSSGSTRFMENLKRFWFSQMALRSVPQMSMRAFKKAKWKLRKRVMVQICPDYVLHVTLLTTPVYSQLCYPKIIFPQLAGQRGFPVWLHHARHQLRWCCLAFERWWQQRPILGWCWQWDGEHCQRVELQDPRM